MKAKVISREWFLNKIHEEEIRHMEILKFHGSVESRGLSYSVYTDLDTRKLVALYKRKKLHMGFNDTPDEKIKEFVDIIEREGACDASWGVTGRTYHMILANQLKDRLPDYHWEIGDNYECSAFKYGRDYVPDLPQEISFRVGGAWFG